MYHFIYPSKDAYIYELNTNSEKNFGGDNNLVLKKEFDTDTLKGVSRILLQFNLSELSSSIVSNKIPTDANYYLRLYEQKTSELSPTYQLDTFPLSSSWEDGTGYTTQDPNSRNGVSWERSNESFDNTQWVTGLGNNIPFTGTGTDLEDNSDTGTVTLNVPDEIVWVGATGPYAGHGHSNTNIKVNTIYQVSFTTTGYTDNGGYFDVMFGNSSNGISVIPVEGKSFTIQNTVPTVEDQLYFQSRNTLTVSASNIIIKEVLTESGSRSTGGGAWYINKAECSQSFSYESPDVNMDVTDMVNNWLDGDTPNNGLILKWSGSQEDSSDYSGDINFFSSDANSIYSPKIEVRWDGSSFNAGSLTQLTIDGTKDNYLYMISLRDTYNEKEIAKFRVGGRERYQTKSASTTKTGVSNLYIPEKSGSYSILDVETGEALVPFGSNSLLSCDAKSNYFKQNLNGFITNRLYRIILRLQLDDGRYRIFDNNFNFKVIN